MGWQITAVMAAVICHPISGGAPPTVLGPVIAARELLRRTRPRGSAPGGTLKRAVPQILQDIAAVATAAATAAAAAPSGGGCSSAKRAKSRQRGP